MIFDRDLERIMAQVETQLPGVSRSGLKGMLFDVINEFFEDSNAWNESLSLTIQPNTQNYTLTPQQGGMIIRLVAIFDTNNIAYPAFVQDFNNPPSVDIALVYPQNTVISTNALVVKNVILPNNRDDVPDAPSWLLPRYGRYIEYGLLGKMAAQPGKTYTNLNLARDMMARFKDSITIVRTFTARNSIYGGQSWRYPSAFRTNSQRGGVSTPFPTPSGWGV